MERANPREQDILIILIAIQITIFESSLPNYSEGAILLLIAAGMTVAVAIREIARAIAS